MELRKIFLFVFATYIVINSLEQEKWSRNEGMNDVYTDLSIQSYYSGVACLECAMKTARENRRAFSCHNGREICVIFGLCHVKSILPSWDCYPEEGWRYFCKEVRLIISKKSSWIQTGISLARRNSIRFKVKVSSDADVALSSGNSTADPAYYIIIGGHSNTKSCIRVELSIGATCYSTYQGSILSGSEYKRLLDHMDK
ncbi:uncharacterized protein LOC133195874 [Saccostrea echinata]|uniref:uncharacterized protein LOC133195874 n=1 Tax=Saccostrea echinata TaxID=191078 RepID=UPI002A829CB7|nr:uncharacterized protein LOC133195874 [Saccostrea echinata]